MTTRKKKLDAHKTTKKQRGRRIPESQLKPLMENAFKPGQSGNPKGRPKGSRNKFGEAFISDFLADWEKHGAKALRAARRNDPAAYLRVAASILPKELNINSDETQLDRLLENMNDKELDNFIRGIAAVGSSQESSAGSAKERAGAEPNTVH